MKYLGIARTRKGQVIMPDTFEVEEGREYDALEIADEILLIPARISKERQRIMERLMDLSLHEHRKSLEDLAH